MIEGKLYFDGVAWRFQGKWERGATFVSLVVEMDWPQALRSNVAALLGRPQGAELRDRQVWVDGRAVAEVYP